MWMSEAFSLIACVSTALIRRMTGRVVLALHEVGGLGQALGQSSQIGLTLYSLDDLSGLAAAALVGLAQEVVESSLRDSLDDEWNAEEAAQLRDGRGLRAFAIDDLRLAVGDAAHEHAVPLRESERQAPDGRDRLRRRARDHRPLQRHCGGTVGRVRGLGRRQAAVRSAAPALRGGVAARPPET